MMKAFGCWPSSRFLRGTPLDIFGYTRERRTERQLIRDYEALLEEIIGELTPHNHALAVALASIPEKIRGFGHVKMRHLAAAKKEEAELLARFRAGEAALPAGGRIAARRAGRRPRWLRAPSFSLRPCSRTWQW